MVIDLFPTSALSTSLNTQQLAKQVRFLVKTLLDTQRRFKDLPFPYQVSPLLALTHAPSSVGRQL